MSHPLVSVRDMEFMVNQASGTGRGNRQGKGAYLSGVMVGDLTDPELTERLAKPRRIVRLCHRRDLLNYSQTDALTEESPLLAGITAASLRHTVAAGERAGIRVRRILVQLPQTRYSNCS